MSQPSEQKQGTAPQDNGGMTPEQSEILRAATPVMERGCVVQSSFKEQATGACETMARAAQGPPQVAGSAGCTVAPHSSQSPSGSGGPLCSVGGPRQQISVVSAPCSSHQRAECMGREQGYG